MRKIKHFRKNGFTIVELLVSMGIFSILMAIIVGAFVTILKLSRIYKNVANLQTEGKIVTESLMRYTKDADSITFANNNICTSGNVLQSSISPINPGAPRRIVAFKCDGGRIQVNTNNPTNPSSTYENLTSNLVTVSNFRIYTTPRVTYPRVLRYDFVIASNADSSVALNFRGYIKLEKRL